MSLLFCTGFGLTNTPGDLFDFVLGATIGAVGRNSGRGLDCNGGSIEVQKNLGVTASTLILGTAVYVFGTPQNGSYLCYFADAGTTQAALTIDSDGTVHATGTSSTFNLSLNVFHYLEVKITFHNTAGAIVVKLDNVEVLNVSSIDTQSSANAYATQVSLTRNQSSFNKHMVFDDVYVLDGVDGTSLTPSQGAALNDFLGDVRVDELLPSGAGSSTQWTPSTGSNYQCVDETPRNDDTDYVSSATVGNKDYYACTDLSSSTGNIKAVVVTSRVRKDDAGTRTIAAKIKRASSEATGASKGLTTSYVYLQDVFALDPSTSTAWTIAGVNAAEVGMEVIA